MSPRSLAIAAAMLAACCPPESGAVDAGGREDAGREDAGRDAGLEGFVAIESQGSLNCARHAEGFALCWGEGVPSPRRFEGVDQVSVAPRRICVRRGAEVECVSTEGGPERETPFGRFASVLAGERWDCALREDESPRCWGEGFLERPRLAEPVRWLGLREGWACAVTASDQAYCWWPEWGADRPRVATPEPAIYPAAPLGDGPFASVFTIDDGGSCGLDPSGEVRCRFERCAYDPPLDFECAPSSEADDLSSAPSGPFTKLVQGAGALCGLRPSGQLSCWGRLYEETYQALEPADLRLRDVAAGDSHVCGVTDEGGLVCWGDDAHGQSTPPAP